MSRLGNKCSGRGLTVPFPALPLRSIAVKCGCAQRQAAQSKNGRVVDFSNGFEDHALEFLDVRDRSPIGHDIVEQWARSLKPHAEVIEFGCSGGRPVTRVLVEAGLNLWAIDASPALPGKFAVRFPAIPVICKQAERSGLSKR